MNQQLIARSRKADVSLFLLDNHSQDIKVSGQCIYLREYPYVYTKMGYCGYVDYHTNRTGNSIDMLVFYLHYTFSEAVKVLSSYPVVHLDAVPIPESKIRCRGQSASFSDTAAASSGFTCSTASTSTSTTFSTGNTSGRQHVPAQVLKASNPVNRPRNARFCIPVPGPVPFTRARNYLHGRCLPYALIDELIEKELLYEDYGEWRNLVFVSRTRDFCELHGTVFHTNQTFHGLQKLYPDTFWSYCTAQNAGSVETAYICESSIDALSLYVLHRQREESSWPTSAYIGIGGVCNQQTIDRISGSVTTILAVDNDAAGQACRERNPHLQAILPEAKDWNEELVNQYTPKCIDGHWQALESYPEPDFCPVAFGDRNPGLPTAYEPEVRKRV